MSDLINMLQTITLLVGLLLSVVVLFMLVYFLGKLTTVFENLMKAIEQIGAPTVIAQTGAAQPSKPETVEEDVPAPSPGLRYPCHRCKAKLPEEPTHSIVKDEINLLVFKCRRCGKETEVNPDKTEPVQPK